MKIITDSGPGPRDKSGAPIPESTEGPGDEELLVRNALGYNIIVSAPSECICTPLMLQSSKLLFWGLEFYKWGAHSTLSSSCGPIWYTLAPGPLLGHIGKTSTLLTSLLLASAVVQLRLHSIKWPLFMNQWWRGGSRLSECRLRPIREDWETFSQLQERKWACHSVRVAAVWIGRSNRLE